MDDRKQRIVVSRAELPHHVLGWEVEDEAELDQLAGRLEAAKVPVARVPRAEAEMRGVANAIRFSDPAGTPLEAFAGRERVLPEEFFDRERMLPTDAFVRYALPLVGAGLPDHERLNP